MLISREDLSTFHFSTADVAPGGRIADYCGLFRRLLERFDTEALDGELNCDARWRRFAELSMLRVTSSPVRVTWNHGSSCPVDDRITLATFRDGNGSVTQRGRTVDIETGGAVVLSGTDLATMVRTNYTYFSLPRATLAPMVGDVDAALMSVIPAGNEALRLLLGYADVLTRTTETMSPELSALTETYMRDLFALAIGATRDGAQFAKGRGLRAARLRAIMADIEKNLGAGNVRPAVLAARHGVTPRYVHKLFEGEGTTLSRFVLGRRLARVYGALHDPRYAGSPVGAIAYDAGFGDLSTFNREFRRRYGSTPSEVRAAAREHEWPEAAGEVEQG